MSFFFFQKIQQNIVYLGRKLAYISFYIHQFILRVLSFYCEKNWKLDVIYFYFIRREISVYLKSS